MIVPISSSLQTVLKSGNSDEISDLDELRSKLIPLFGDASRCAAELIPPLKAKLRNGRLLQLLGTVCQNDSVVRDVITSGHLAKLLARFHLTDSGNLRALSVSNYLFDQLSHRDRHAYFAMNQSFAMSTSLLNDPQISKMRNAEMEILSRFGLQ